MTSFNNDIIKEKNIPKLETISVDIVITWVDNTDPSWISSRNKHNNTSYGKVYGDREIRFINYDSLRYVLRGIYKHMKWIRNIYITSANQKPPSWLVVNKTIGFSDKQIKCTPNTKYISSLIWVNHAAFMPSESLPTFNSHSIEACIHDIPDLSEYFVYFNSDMFVNKDIKITDVFDNNLKPILRKSTHMISSNKYSCKNNTSWRNFLNKNLLTISTPMDTCYMYKHIAMPFTKSLMKEGQEKFKELWKNTTNTKFRSYNSDISPFFVCYYIGLKNNKLKMIAQDKDTYYISIDINTIFKPIILPDCMFSCLNLVNSNNNIIKSVSNINKRSMLITYEREWDTKPINEITINYFDVENKLKSIADCSNTLIEGNTRGYIDKQYNIGKLASRAINILEIGFNTGYSSAVILCSNMYSYLLVIDINSHKYVEPCYKYLENMFKGRIISLFGDSKKVIPNLTYRNKNTYDLIHIDGGHSLKVASSDLYGSVILLKRGGYIIFDDSHKPHLEKLLNSYVKAKIIKEVNYKKMELIECPNQRIFTK